MNYSENFVIASFRSRSSVQKFAAALRRRGVNCRLISTPKEVAIGCGLSVRVEPAGLNAAISEYRTGAHGALIGFYQVSRMGSKTTVTPIRV